MKSVHSFRIAQQNKLSSNLSRVLESSHLGDRLTENDFSQRFMKFYTRISKKHLKISESAQRTSMGLK